MKGAAVRRPRGRGALRRARSAASGWNSAITSRTISSRSCEQILDAASHTACVHHRGLLAATSNSVTDTASRSPLDSIAPESTRSAWQRRAEPGEAPRLRAATAAPACAARARTPPMRVRPAISSSTRSWLKYSARAACSWLSSDLRADLERNRPRSTAAPRDSSTALRRGQPDAPALDDLLQQRRDRAAARRRPGSDGRDPWRAGARSRRAHSSPMRHRRQRRRAAVENRGHLLGRGRAPGTAAAAQHFVEQHAERVESLR